jgi:hypothetical protein
VARDPHVLDSIVLSEIVYLAIVVVAIDILRIAPRAVRATPVDITTKSPTNPIHRSNSEFVNWMRNENLCRWQKKSQAKRCDVARNCQLEGNQKMQHLWISDNCRGWGKRNFWKPLGKNALSTPTR